MEDLNTPTSLHDLRELTQIRAFNSLDEVPEKYRLLGHIVCIADPEQIQPFKMYMWDNKTWQPFPDAERCPTCGQVMPKKMEVAKDGTILSIT